MNALTQAIRRVEVLYWTCNRSGGPDLELLAILKLLRAAEAELDGCELSAEPPRLGIVRPD